MVFFTSIIIVAILYYLQAEGLIYVTIIAVVAELINMFMTQTLTKSVEKKLNTKWGKMIDGYKNQIAAKNRTIKELEQKQDDSIQKLYMAQKKLKEYKEQHGLPEEPAPDVKEKKAKTPEEPPPKEASEKYDDLPCGSDGIKRRV